jgi:hypothetical protein
MRASLLLLTLLSCGGKKPADDTGASDTAHSNQPPDAAFTSPEAGAVAPNTGTLRVVLQVSDDLDAPELLLLDWTENTAQFGPPDHADAHGEASFHMVAPPTGTWSLGATVTDSAGAVTGAELSFRVVTDADGDGYGAISEGGDDCDDGDDSINPGQQDTCDNGVDEDCSGEDLTCWDLSLAEADAIIRGEQRSGTLGYELCGAGDINGDGHGDIWVSEVFYSLATNDNPGVVRAFFGPFSGEMLASDADIELMGMSHADYAGVELAVGSVDGTGPLDLLTVSAYEDSADAREGTAYLVLGDSLAGGDMRLDNADAVFYSLAASGAYDRDVDLADLDGDGQDEILLAVSQATPLSPPFYDYGAVYIYPSDTRGHHMVTSAPITLYGRNNEDSGQAAASAGDVDGDGLGDVIVGAPSMGTGGGAYFLAGPITASLDLSQDSVQLTGEHQTNAGFEVAGGGDVDGDGLDDIAVAAPWFDGSLDNAGAIYLFTTVPTAGDVTQAEAILHGDVALTNAGRALDMGGDANGDGRADLLIGGKGGDGHAWLVMGPFEGTSSLRDAPLHVTGEQPGEEAGWAARFAGDLDADGSDDLLVGAPEAGSTVAEAGAAYVLFTGGLF